MNKKYKVVQISDTHVRNRKYHEEYKEVFRKLYNIIKEENPDFIVHCGDIFHLKTVLSPESVALVSDFLKNLSELAPTYVLLGNHDTNLRNKQRMDAISPIVANIGSSNLHYSRDSVVYHVNEDIDLYMWSLLDSNGWGKPKNKNKINICAYHGAVYGSQTDMGYPLQHSDIKLNDFKDFDFAFLGDIHKPNQAMDKEGRVRYAGSTIQQNFGEEDDKGVLIWEIQDKDNFEVRQIVIPHPKPFINLHLNEDGEFEDNRIISPGSKIRLVSKKNMSIDKVRSITDYVQTRYKPEYVTFANNTSKENNVKLELPKAQENLRSILVQEKLYSDYLKEYKVEPEVLQKVYEINKKYDDICNVQDDVLRNVTWEIQELSWNNFFNYGKDNKVNFNNLDGIVGIFGKNFSGKSSIFDTLLLTLFNSDSKSSRKNVHYINENQKFAEASVKVKIGNTLLHIDRTFIKNMKKLKGVTSIDASVNVIFQIEDLQTGEIIFKTKDKRNQTDEEIQKYIGSLENFLLSSMSAQNSALKFLDQKNTKRKEIIAKFLDLELFEKKYRLAKDEMKLLKGQMKSSEGINYDHEFLNIQQRIDKNEEETERQNILCQQYKTKLQIYQERHDELEQVVKQEKLLNIEEIEESLKTKNYRIETIKLSDKKNKESTLNLKELLIKYEKLLNEVDLQELKEEKGRIKTQKEKFNKLLNEIKQEELHLKVKQKKVELLEEVPCGEQFSHCKFIKDAWAALESLQQCEETLALLKEQNKNMDKVDYSSEEKRVEEYIQDYNQTIRKKEKTSSDLSKIQIIQQKHQIELKNLHREVEELMKDKHDYLQNKDIYENLTHHKDELKKIKKDIKKISDEFVACEAKYINLHSERGALLFQQQNLEKEYKAFKTLLLEYTAMDMFLKASHSHGIPYSIIKRKLPILNEEIAKILNKIVEFEVFLETEDNKLNIYIKHPKYNARPIEGASGAEKSFAAIALRLALINVSNLPTSNLFILDEPGTSFDESNLEGFTRILDTIKEHFRIVFLVSHMDSLKDVVDMTIDIEKSNGYAKVVV